ncbi:MAG: glycine/betaine/sarcosine/D-proline family reductase selenoprotein B [Actinomycetia bacterium]|nr:glycine/betaine/sarcosine/D-proline family reductase selenoprotein B [Actinomycetes bacterium]
MDLDAAWQARYEQWLAAARPWLAAQAWRRAFEQYPWAAPTGIPWTPWTRPLRHARIALVGSGGLTIPGQPPFDAGNPEGDTSFRIIPDRGPLPAWRIDHGHYDTTAAQTDYNVVFPLDVLRELVAERVVGDLSPRAVTFMGYIPNAREFLAQSAPRITEVLRYDAVDGVLLVPV